MPNDFEPKAAPITVVQGAGVQQLAPIELAVRPSETKQAADTSAGGDAAEGDTAEPEATQDGATEGVTDEPRATRSDPEPADDAPSTGEAGKTATRRAAVAPQMVPPATGNDAVITVKVGGDRTGLAGVTTLAGVVLGFYDNEAGGAPAYQCTSDADGDCSITVPDTQPGDDNRDRRFYVRQISASGGWYENPVLRTGSNGANPSFSTPYVFETGNRLRSGNTYRSGSAFMIDEINGNNRNRLDSGGVWQNSRTNPVLPQTCGLNVALVMDFSGSTENFNGQLKQAANTFVDALVGTPSRMALFSFGSNSPARGAQNYPDLTSVSTQAQADAFKARYSGWNSFGGTNWDRGLAVAAEAGNPFDVVVVITDGNPTQYGSPPKGFSGNGRLIEAEAGIFSANAIKAEGTRLIAVGVGSAITRDPNADLNLRAISGQTEYDGSNSATADFYRTQEYSVAGDALKELALGNCLGSISVIKQVVPSTAPPGSIEGAEPEGGWTLDAASGDVGISVNPPASRVTADGTGAVNFPLTFQDATTTGPVGITETQQPGYTLQQVAGKNAVCTRSDTGADVAVANQGALGFTVPASSTYPVSCTLYNRAPGPQASVVVDKVWAVTVGGVTTRYAEGTQPAGLDATATIDGTSQGWGNPRRGFGVGDPVTIDETASITGRPLCTLGEAQVTEANGEPATEPLPYNPTLDPGLNSYIITNPVTCTTQLTLAKEVLGGPADASLWDLSATAPAGALPGPSGKTGTDSATNVPVTANAVYTLAEGGGDPRYIQRANPNATPIPGSTISWECVALSADGETVIPGYSDGLNGGVTVPLGSNVRCTASNYTATLQVRKIVGNTHGGTAKSADFTITATPTGDDLPPGLTAQTVAGADEYQAFTVRPDVTYRITETGPDGYTQESIDCTVTDGEPTTDGTLEVPPLETGSCTVVNVDSPAHLTLVKTVANDHGGTAAPADWTLTADGPTPGVTGKTGEPAVTQAPVEPGTYTLSESDGPAGYTPSDWSCDGGALDGSSLTLAMGDSATCTITNTAQPGEPAIDKKVTGTTQNADGTWVDTYDVTVTNRDADGTGMSTRYDLSDSLRFGDGIRVVGASVMGPDGVTLVDGWNGQGQPDIASGVRLQAHASHVYHVTVKATVTSSASAADRDCTVVAGEDGTGFRNEATVAAGDFRASDSACAEITGPTGPTAPPTSPVTPPTAPTTPSAPQGPGSMAVTGANSAAAALGGLLMLLAGGFLVVASRRRRSQ